MGSSSKKASGQAGSGSAGGMASNKQGRAGTKGGRGSSRMGLEDALSKLKLWQAASITALAATLVYLNSLHGEFVFDDFPAIVNNADVDPAKTSLASTFNNNFWGQEMGAPWSQHYSYRPLTTLTFRWNVAIFGFDTFWFHAANTCLHAIASALVTCVAARLCIGFAPWVPLIVGLVFAVHPVHTEAVANIVCRAELLACIFWCLAFLAYSRGMQAARSSSPHARPLVFTATLAATTVLTVTSVLCKEQGFTVLPVLMVYDLLYFGDADAHIRSLLCRLLFGPRSGRQGTRRQAADPKKSQQQGGREGGGASATAARREGGVGEGGLGTSSATSSLSSSLFRVAVIGAVTAAVFAWRVSLNTGDEVKVDEKTNPANHIQDPLLRALTKNYYVFLHMWLLLFPAQLCCDWSSFGIPNVASGADPRNLQTAGLYFAVVYGVLYTVLHPHLPRVLRRLVLIAVAITAITFVPASGLLIEVGFVVAERVLYTPCLGVCLLFAAAAAHVLRAYAHPLSGEDDVHSSSSSSSSESEEAHRFTRRAVFVAVAGALLLMGARTWLRNYDWRDVTTLYETGLQVLPMNAKLNHNFAHSTTDPLKKEYHYRAAIYIYPPYASAYINLGVHLAQTNRLDEAVQIWKRGLDQWQRRPIVGSDPVVLNLNIGTGLKNLGRLTEARPYLQACLRYDPHKQQCIQRLREVDAAMAQNRRG